MVSKFTALILLLNGDATASMAIEAKLSTLSLAIRRSDILAPSLTTIPFPRLSKLIKSLSPAFWPCALMVISFWKSPEGTPSKFVTSTLSA